MVFYQFIWTAVTVRRGADEKGTMPLSPPHLLTFCAEAREVEADVAGALPGLVYGRVLLDQERRGVAAT